MNIGRPLMHLLCVCAFVGFLAAGATCFVSSSMDAGALHPELRHLDSAEIPGYGFPATFWMPDDSFAEIHSHRSRFLLKAFLADAGVFGVIATVVIFPVWLLALLIGCCLRRRPSE